WASVWVDSWQGWAVCEPQLTDERPGEIVPAMRHFAGRQQAHVVRSDAPADSAVHALGAVDSDVHTDVGPTAIYPAKMANAAGIGLVILAFLAFAAVLLLRGPVDGVPLGMVVLCLALFSVAVLSFVELGYVYWNWRQHRTMTVSPVRIEIRT